jgi:CRP/FNR family cyclic AMP-dependent transcriptional regulator
MKRSSPMTDLPITRLSEPEREALHGYVARAVWPAGFQVYERGTPADGLFIVEAGRIVLRSRVRAARGFVPWIATCGETFGAEGLSAGGRYVTDARTDTQTETLFLSSGKLRAFLREQPIHAMALIGQVMAERAVLLEKLRELTTLSVEQRLVLALRRMTMHDSFVGADGRIELGSPRYRLLCELVGATRESVALVLGRLMGEGLVERSGGTVWVTPSALLFERLDRAHGDADVMVGTLDDVANAELRA